MTIDALVAMVAARDVESGDEAAPSVLLLSVHHDLDKLWTCHRTDAPSQQRATAIANLLIGTILVARAFGVDDLGGVVVNRLGSFESGPTTDESKR